MYRNYATLHEFTAACEAVSQEFPGLSDKEIAKIVNIALDAAAVVRIDGIDVALSNVYGGRYAH